MAFGYALTQEELDALAEQQAMEDAAATAPVPPPYDPAQDTQGMQIQPGPYTPAPAPAPVVVDEYSTYADPSGAGAAPPPGPEYDVQTIAPSSPPVPQPAEVSTPAGYGEELIWDPRTSPNNYNIVDQYTGPPVAPPPARTTQGRYGPPTEQGYATQMAAPARLPEPPPELQSYTPAYLSGSDASYYDTTVGAPNPHDPTQAIHTAFLPGATYPLTNHPVAQLSAADGRDLATMRAQRQRNQARQTAAAAAPYAGINAPDVLRPADAMALQARREQLSTLPPQDVPARYRVPPPEPTVIDDLLGNAIPFTLNAFGRNFGWGTRLGDSARDAQDAVGGGVLGDQSKPPTPAGRAGREAGRTIDASIDPTAEALRDAARAAVLASMGLSSSDAANTTRNPLAPSWDIPAPETGRSASPGVAQVRGIVSAIDRVTGDDGFGLPTGDFLDPVRQALDSAPGPTPTRPVITLPPRAGGTATGPARPSSTAQQTAAAGSLAAHYPDGSTATIPDGSTITDPGAKGGQYVRDADGNYLGIMVTESTAIFYPDGATQEEKDAINRAVLAARNGVPAPPAASATAELNPPPATGGSASGGANTGAPMITQGGTNTGLVLNAGGTVLRSGSSRSRRSKKRGAPGVGTGSGIADRVVGGTGRVGASAGPEAIDHLRSRFGEGFPFSFQNTAMRQMILQIIRDSMAKGRSTR